MYSLSLFLWRLFNSSGFCNHCCTPRASQALTNLPKGLALGSASESRTCIADMGSSSHYYRGHGGGPTRGRARVRGGQPTIPSSLSRGTATRSAASPAQSGLLSRPLDLVQRQSENVSRRLAPSKETTSLLLPTVTKSFFYIELQEFEGSWTEATELATIVGMKEKVLSKKKEPYGIALVVIAFWEEKMHEEKETWDLSGLQGEYWVRGEEFPRRRSRRRRLVRSFSGESESLFLLGVLADMVEGSGGKSESLL